MGNKRHNATNVISDKPNNATNVIRDKPNSATNVISDKPNNVTNLISDKHHNLPKATNVISDNVIYDVCRLWQIINFFYIKNKIGIQKHLTIMPIT